MLKDGLEMKARRSQRGSRKMLEEIKAEKKA